ncbi:MAG: cyclic nucleotide-binding domain-containing protein [Syntrophobacteria bacterium]
MADEKWREDVDLEDGATALGIRTYGEDEEIIAEGEDSSHFYVVLSGNVKVTRHGRQLAILGERDVLGLESCFFNRPSSVSACSIDKTRIAMYDREAIEFILYERPQMSKGVLLSLLEQLAQTSQAVGQEEAGPKAENVDVSFYGDNEVIIEEGARDTDIFKLISTEQGLVASKGGREVGRITNPGEFFGEMASVLNNVRSATIISKGSSVVQVYSADNIQDMIEEHPEIAKRIIRTLAKRLSKATKEITRLKKELETNTRTDS